MRNQLKVLQAEAFEPLKSLEILSASENQIEKIDRKMMGTFMKAVKIDLRLNRCVDDIVLVETSEYKPPTIEQCFNTGGKIGIKVFLVFLSFLVEVFMVHNLY
jgi:hypothetical protein